MYVKDKIIDHVGILTIQREEALNALNPDVLKELNSMLIKLISNHNVDSIIITGAGEKAFCSGGDQNVKGVGGYVGEDGVPRLNVLDLHKKIREIPKPVIAMVNGYAIGGGHVLHVVCDLTIASENAIFGQT